MIKNVLTLLAAGLVVSPCLACDGRARAGEPAPFQGVVEYDDRLLGFEVGGRIQDVGVQRGQDVAADTPLMRLDDSMERPQRDLRAAELAAAEAQLRLLKAGARGEELRAAAAEIAALRSQEDMLQKNLARQQTLFQQSALPQSTLDDTSSQLRATEERRRALEERLQALRNGARGDEIAAAVARVQAAQAALAAQEARLARYVLRSPAAGNIVDVQLEPGELVSPGTPALTLADIDHPYVDVFVPQARAHELRVGEAMRVRVDGLDAPLAGRVEHIFPKTEFTPRYLFSEGERPNLVLRTRVRVDDPKRVLHAGVPAFVTAADSAEGPQS
ncbi:MAG TPA: HlyD family efflux transporter periplasmic adaptor subunit [Polyangiales bacterium]|nr:HlyD family efflux transporter periplasmic adaptor subunit [Polyangiales bacterium]